MEQDNIFTPEIVEDMPDFEENTAEMPCESEKSVGDCPADSENEIVSEENEVETEEKAEESAETPAESKDKTKTEKKPKQTFKSNLPTGFSFNPLVMAIKPFYEKLIGEDEIFANVVKERESRKEKPKSLKECAEYIMSEAYNYASKHRNGQMGMAGFPDEDMYQLIRHYYDEEWLEVQPMRGASVSVSKTTTPTPKPTATPTTPAKAEKKGKEKPEQPKNVMDIRKAIVSSTGKETGKKAKKKDSLSAGFVPMERPSLENYEKEAKKGSRQQAKSIEQMDLFADFFAE